MTLDAFSQNDFYGDFVQPFYADDMFTRLTINPDSTFEYHHIYLRDQKEKGRWKKYGDILFLYGCESCNLTEPLKVKTNNKAPKIITQWPFEFKYISIRGDSLFVVRPINDIEPTPRLIRKSKPTKK